MIVKEGWNKLELDLIAIRGSKDVNNAEVLIKSTENDVWAVSRFKAVNPFVSNKALKALIAPSVVKLGLAIW